MVNWGEPFLNRHLPYFASRCREHGIMVHVDSHLNVKYWTDEEARDIVASGLNSILGSIDGASQAAYEKYRVRGKLDMALHNLGAPWRRRSAYRSGSSC